VGAFDGGAFGGSDGEALGKDAVWAKDELLCPNAVVWLLVEDMVVV